MLKMLMDPMGGIVMTNDGNAILREIQVQHPAAKSMIEISRTQDEEVNMIFITMLRKTCCYRSGYQKGGYQEVGCKESVCQKHGYQEGGYQKHGLLLVIQLQFTCLPKYVAIRNKFTKICGY